MPASALSSPTPHAIEIAPLRRLAAQIGNMGTVSRLELMRPRRTTGHENRRPWLQVFYFQQGFRLFS